MTHWRKQQQKDRYFQQAKAEGYRARSAYKLLQIQERFKVLKRGDVVVDLGAAPGSWSQVASKIVGPQGRVIALDLQAIEPLPGVTILQGDMTDPAVQQQVIAAAGGPVDVVLSDAAPFTSGIKVQDHARSIALAEAALAVARRLLKPGGHLIIKVFEGSDLAQFLQETRRSFQTARLHAPEASRQESKETFVIALGFKGPDSVVSP